MLLDSFVFTSAGGRGYNEDAALAQESADGGLYLVADGLGGHAHSEQAAQAVIESLGKAEAPKGEEKLRGWLEAQIENANEKVLALQRETHLNMKSTLAALLVRGREAIWANVGDSRVYFLRGGEIADVTQDHSVAFKKYKAGEITRDQIGQDEDQSALLQALGNPERHIPSFYASPDALKDGDAFLLCSDGVWEYVRDGEILVDLLKSETAREWAEHLLLRVIDRVQGENDNLTLLTVIVREGEEDR